MKKRLTILFLAAIFLFSIVPGSALAATTVAAVQASEKSDSRAAQYLASSLKTAGLTYYKVNSSTLKVRVSPSSSASSVCTLAKDAVLIRLDATNYKKEGTTWYKVQVQLTGKTGYVSSSYVTKIATPDPSRILSLTPSTGALTPAFATNTLKYNYYLADSLNQFTISYKLGDASATVALAVDGTPVTTGNVINFVENGTLTITVTVGTRTSVYALKMLRESAEVSQIKSLSLSGVSISPAFNPAVRTYTASVPYKTIETSAVIKKFSSYSEISYYIGSDKSEDGFMPILMGDNVFKIVCKSPLGKSTTYTINIKRAKPKPGERPIMSALDRRIVETAFQLLPERHPFVLAYEAATGRNIKSYTTVRNGKRISGVAFEFGGSGNFTGFSSRWWRKTSVAKYPVGGLDCAEYLHWIYKNIGYNVPDASNTLFLSGVTGATRSIPGVRKHKVITSLKAAKIGDIAYNSAIWSFGSGHGNHSSMFLGTARQLGIEDTIRKYYKKFPIDAYLVIDIGWADGIYYHNMIRKIGAGGRDDLCGVGVQFFSSIKQNGKYIYKSPYKTGKSSFSWYDSKSKQTYHVSANIERNHRPYQYNPASKIKYIMNLSRPIRRND